MDFKVILQPLALDDLEAMSHASDSETDMGADHEQDHEHERSLARVAGSTI